MMPRTANGAVDEQPLDERTVVVGAMRPDCKQLQAAAHQQNLLVTDMTNELATVGKLARNNALRQIGAGELRLILSHVLLLLTKGGHHDEKCTCEPDIHCWCRHITPIFIACKILCRAYREGCPSLPFLRDISVAVYDWRPLVARSRCADMADAGKRNMRDGDERAVAGKLGEGRFPHLSGEPAIDVVGNGDVRFRKLHRTHMDDVTDEDDSLPVTFDRVESAAGRMPWVHSRADSRRDLGGSFECLPFARAPVMLERCKVVIEIIHPIMRFGRV